jgi:hypothetical protein
MKGNLIMKKEQISYRLDEFVANNVIKCIAKEVFGDENYNATAIIEYAVNRRHKSLIQNKMNEGEEIMSKKEEKIYKLDECKINTGSKDNQDEKPEYKVDNRHCEKNNKT